MVGTSVTSQARELSPAQVPIQSQGNIWETGLYSRPGNYLGNRPLFKAREIYGEQAFIQGQGIIWGTGLYSRPGNYLGNRPLFSKKA